MKEDQWMLGERSRMTEEGVDYKEAWGNCRDDENIILTSQMWIQSDLLHIMGSLKLEKQDQLCERMKDS